MSRQRSEIGKFLAEAEKIVAAAGRSGIAALEAGLGAIAAQEAAEDRIGSAFLPPAVPGCFGEAFPEAGLRLRSGVRGAGPAGRLLPLPAFAFGWRRGRSGPVLRRAA